MTTEPADSSPAEGLPPRRPDRQQCVDQPEKVDQAQMYYNFKLL